MGGIALFLYLIDVLSALDVVAAIVGWAFLIIGFLTVVLPSITIQHNEDDGLQYFVTNLPKRYKFLWIPALCFMTAVFIPSQNTMYMMGGVVAVDAVSKMESVQQLGGEAGGLAIDTIKTLREKLNEIAGTKTETADTK